WGTVQGTAADSSNVPLSGVAITTSAGGSTTTGEDGSYSVPTARGTVTVTPGPAGQLVTPDPVVATVASATATVVNFKYRRFNHLRGVVQDDAGVALDGVMVEVWLGSTKVDSQATAANGSYDFALSPATYRLVFDPFSQPAQQYVTASPQEGVKVLTTGPTEAPAAVYTRFGSLKGPVSSS